MSFVVLGLCGSGVGRPTGSHADQTPGLPDGQDLLRAAPVKDAGRRLGGPARVDELGAGGQAGRERLVPDFRRSVRADALHRAAPVVRTVA